MNNARKVTLATLSGITLIGAAGVLAGWGSSSTTSSITSSTEVSSVESNKKTTTYASDPVHSNVIFKIGHGSVSNFYGRFNDVKGTVEHDSADFTNSSFSFVVDTGSVDTNNRSRDGHIKGADFFNARQYPEATFNSTSISDHGDGTYTLSGDFEFHGKKVPIEAKLHDVKTGKFRDNEVMGFEAVFSIKRSDFGITKYLDENNPESGPLGDTVELIVAVEAVKQ
jgi:polyisoprenoid-binding protein YceI